MPQHALSIRIVLFFIFSLLVNGPTLMAQMGTITGQISDKLTNEPIIGANVVLIGTDKGTATDLDGKFSLLDVVPGIYSIEISYIGYNPVVFNEIEVQSKRPTIINGIMTESGKLLDEVVVKAANFRKTAESPVSLRNIGVSEIKRNPGGNRDISRVIQSLPGVTSTASFRNDLIIRGGAPNENRFYIDDIETPAINHFATQGSSGGPAGLINVDFLREVDFFSGAFPASRSNALSSVFNFKFKDGRDDRVGMNATIGATDIGATLDGPIGEKTTFLVSARRSYLQFLFKAVGLPFLPTYTDFNAKVKYKINKKNEVYFLGLGAIDDFELNPEANDTESKQYILDRLPINTQWNYTNGIVYKHYGEKGFTTLVLNRNMLNNNAIKYYNNDENTTENLILDYNSREIENKFRIERTTKTSGFEFSYGANAEYAKYTTNTFNKIFTNAGAETVDYNSEIGMIKYGAFFTTNKSYLNEKLRVSVGIRMDGNNVAPTMENPLKQLSPRMSLSYKFAENWAVNFNTGIYYQLPPYTSIGFRSNGNLVNLDNGLKYIGVKHIVAGLEYNYNNYGRVTLEGYFKSYSHYPILLREGISLANLGGDFGVIGNQQVASDGIGETYGFEMMIQQKLYKGFYGIIAYTLGESRFTNINNSYAPSSWDARHIINMTLGKRFRKNWELGVKYRFQSGLPGTPYANTSDLVVNWQRNAGGIFDYAHINSLRYEGGGTLDVRMDKKWFFKKWDINLYLDIQNVFGSAISRQVLILDRPLDADGRPLGTGIIVNPDAPQDLQRYALKSIDDSVGTTLPTIGLVISI
ncbi:MAG: TonB-dependent receptor [Saprospiraceae bacterium]